MAPTLYTILQSPPVRATQMVIKALGLKVNEVEVNAFEGEHLKPEFLKLNPQHTVPTLVDHDNDLTIWDSHAIVTYLVSKYGKDDWLYPKDLKKRALVDQRLHFESSVVFPIIRKLVTSILREGKTALTQDDKESFHNAYGLVDSFLEDGKGWIAGNHVTVADFSLISSISTLNLFEPIDGSRYVRLANWVKKVEGLPAYEANKPGLERAHQLFGSRIQS